jgi:hypothetical protein
MSFVEVNIGGEVRGFKFNQMAVITMAKYLDYDNLNATYLYAVVFGGLSANAFVKREEFTHSFETVCDWVDEMSIEDAQKVQACFEETQVYKKLVEVGQASTEQMTKKKQPKKSEKDIK